MATIAMRLSILMLAACAHLASAARTGINFKTPLAARDTNGREHIGIILGSVLGSVTGLICIFFIVIVLVLRRDPEFRQKLTGTKVEEVAPPYSEEDPERQIQGQQQGHPQQNFELQTVKGATNGVSGV